MYESSIVLNMAALRNIIFEDSLQELFRDVNLENVSFPVEQQEAISNIVVLEQRHSNHFTERVRANLLPTEDFIVRKLANEKH